MVFLEGTAVVSEGLVVEGVEVLARPLGVVETLRESDDLYLLLLADVQLIDELVMDLHQLLLKNCDLLLVLAAVPPLRLLRKHLSLAINNKRMQEAVQRFPI
jgi:hypothetical protein